MCYQLHHPGETSQSSLVLIGLNFEVERNINQTLIRSEMFTAKVEVIPKSKNNLPAPRIEPGSSSDTITRAICVCQQDTSEEIPVTC